MRLPITMTATLALAICSVQNDAPKSLDVCTVADRIEFYHKQHVRVTAFLGTGAEASALYDPKCRGGEWLVSVDYKDGLFKAEENASKELLRITKKNGYALVMVEGTMYGPEPVSIDPNYPNWMKERMKGSMKRYGHQGSFAMMIEVDKILDAREVDDGLTPKTK